MRREDDIVQTEKVWIEFRLALEHIHPGPGQTAGTQGRDQRGIVDNAAARDVAQMRRRLHQRQFGGADSMMVRGGVGQQ